AARRRDTGRGGRRPLRQERPLRLVLPARPAHDALPAEPGGSLLPRVPARGDGPARRRPPAAPPRGRARPQDEARPRPGTAPHRDRAGWDPASCEMSRTAHASVRPRCESSASERGEGLIVENDVALYTDEPDVDVAALDEEDPPDSRPRFDDELAPVEEEPI